MTKMETFDSLEKWLDELNKVTANVCKIIVGNKCDLIDSKVNTDKARELASKYDAKFIMASAAENKNVSEIYYTLAVTIYHNNLKKERLNKTKKKSLTINDNGILPQSSGCC